jgi:hypothetical protein
MEEESPCLLRRIPCTVNLAGDYVWRSNVKSSAGGGGSGRSPAAIGLACFIVRFLKPPLHELCDNPLNL